MNRTPNFDLRIKSILDATTPGERTCAALGTKWVMDEAEISQYRKYNVPPSKFAPLTRMKLMMGYFVMFDFWYNKHAETGAPLLSPSHPASDVRVLPDKEWFQRSFEEYGRDVDMSRSILDQLHELTRAVPQAANYNYVLPENSTAFISLGDQDSHFTLACSSKRTFYSLSSFDVEDSAEIAASNRIRNSYNVLHSERIYQGRFLRECYDCIDCDFCFDCRNCEHCFGSSNKRNKHYLWFNEQLTREEWERRKAEVDLRSWEMRSDYERRFLELIGQAIWPENFNVKDEESTGEYLSGAYRVQEGYFLTNGSRDMSFAAFGHALPSRDCYCVAAPVGSSDCYYSLGIKTCSRCLFALSIMTNCIDTEYCGSCTDLEHCFGCFGLKKKKFCIFNKQYSETEYWLMLDAIKCKMLDDGEYGDYPPMRFGYQYVERSGSPVVYGATRDEMIKLGAQLFEVGAEGAEGPAVDPLSIGDVDGIPDRIEDSAQVVGKPFFDKVYGRRFGYVRPELALYEKLGVAPPRKHPTRRINELYAEMNMAIAEQMHCAQCRKGIRVAVNRTFPKRTVYCRGCYLAEIEKRG